MRSFLRFCTYIDFNVYVAVCNKHVFGDPRLTFFIWDRVTAGLYGQINGFMVPHFAGWLSMEIDWRAKELLRPLSGKWCALERRVAAPPQGTLMGTAEVTALPQDSERRVQAFPCNPAITNALLPRKKTIFTSIIGTHLFRPWCTLLASSICFLSIHLRNAGITKISYSEHSPRPK